MICNKVVDLGVEICKNLRRGGDKRRLVAVATGKVLRSNDADRIAMLGFYQQYLAVIVSKIGALNNLGDERPEFERLVGCLVVENKVNPAHTLILCDEKESAKKFLRYGERSLPDLGDADLPQNPFENVGHLDGITQIRLKRCIFQRSKDLVDVGGAFHFADFLALLTAERLREGVGLGSAT